MSARKAPVSVNTLAQTQSDPTLAHATQATLSPAMDSAAEVRNV